MAQAFPYFRGRSTRQVLQVVNGTQRTVEVAVDVVQGKVLSVSKLKTNSQQNDYCIARIASGAQGITVLKGYDGMAHEIAALTTGEIVSCDGRHRPASEFDRMVGGVVVTDWFTARSMTLLAPVPVAENEQVQADEYDGAPL